MEVELLTQQHALARQRADVASIFAAHHAGLVRLALLMVGDQASAEDVVQEAFARTHAGRGRLRDADNALAYVRSAVLNGCRSVLRRRATAFRRPVPYEPPVWSAESSVLVGEERREVLPALRDLPRRQRQPGVSSVTYLPCVARQAALHAHYGSSLPDSTVCSKVG